MTSHLLPHPAGKPYLLAVSSLSNETVAMEVRTSKGRFHLQSPADVTLADIDRACKRCHRATLVRRRRAAEEALRQFNQGGHDLQRKAR